MALNDEYFDLALDDDGFAEYQQMALTTFGIPLTDIAHEQALALVMTTMCIHDEHLGDALLYIQDAAIQEAFDDARDRGALRPLRISIVPRWWQRLYGRRRESLSWSS